MSSITIQTGFVNTLFHLIRQRTNIRLAPIQSGKQILQKKMSKFLQPKFRLFKQYSEMDFSACSIRPTFLKPNQTLHRKSKQYNTTYMQ